jgi:hypothetical protein
VCSGAKQALAAFAGTQQRIKRQRLRLEKAVEQALAVKGEQAMSVHALMATTDIPCATRTVIRETRISTSAQHLLPPWRRR